MSLPSLRDLLAYHFNLEELDALCFDLNIKFEDIPGATLSARAQALVQHCLRHNRLTDLSIQCRQLRPTPDWPDTEGIAVEWQKVQQGITAQKGLQGILSDEQIVATLTALKQKEAELLTQLIGSGAIAQGEGAVAVGEGGVYVGGSVSGDVVLGTKVTTIDPRQTDPEALRQAYLQRVLASSNQLSLAGVDPKAAGADQEQLELAAIYTALLTESREDEDWQQRERLLPREPRRFSALEMLNKHRRLVLLGDPGSGKSTFVNFVAVCLAGALLQHPQLNLKLLRQPLPSDEPDNSRRSREEKPQPQPWQHGALLPVTIVLRDLAARGLPEANERATADHFWRFVTDELNAASLGEYVPLLKKSLLEQGGLLLFDGLDEVPQADNHRVHIKQLVEDVANTFGRCHILVTSRTYAYQQQAWLLPSFQDTVLLPFSRGQIVAFVERWYRHMAQVRNLNQADAQGRAVLLRQAILTNARLQELAARPLLLTLMASLHAWRGGSLPEKREELYADAVELLLDNWEKQRVVRDGRGKVRVIQPSLQQWLQVDRDQVRTELDHLAFMAHEAQEHLEGTADIAESDLIAALMRLSQNPDVNPVQLVAYLRDRAGLLLSRGVGVYTFPHRTFQEYLAASHLTNDEYPAQVAQLARIDPNRWREVALLAGAKASRGSSYGLWGLVQELCYGKPDSKAEAAAHWGARLAGQLLIENVVLATLSQSQQEQARRLAQWLVAVMEGARLPALERATAGRYLADLGDPRRGVGVIERDGRKLPDIVWGEEVPAGRYPLGGDGKAYRSFDKREVQIVYPYRLSCYPITNAQFQCFIEAPDWDDRRWWQDIPSNEQAFGKPYFPHANHPREMVSWYQAVAFCRWLSDKLGYEVSLPHEYEWEVAARYPDGRFYPWGHEFEADRANTVEGGVGQTTAVGLYPSGKNEALNLYDLSGNVWEWCRNKFENPDDETIDQSGRVVRGGSWNFFQYFARAAYRFDPPDNRSYFVGVRLVVRRSPSQPAL